MIAHNAQLTITCLLLEQIQIKEYQPRYLDQLHLYLKKLQDHPGEYAGLLSVVPSDTHEGMHFIGIEMNDTQDEPYVTIARARIEQAFREVQHD